MEINRHSKTTRRTFLQGATVGAAAVGGNFAFPSLAGAAASASSPRPILRLETDPKQALIPVLSWDTEGGDRVRTNLLRSPGIGLRMYPGSEWVEGTAFTTTLQRLPRGTRYLFHLPGNSTLQWEIVQSGEGFTMTVSGQGSWVPRLGRVEIVFPFDPGVTPTTVLPSLWREDGDFEAPLVVSAPDFGQMLLRVTPPGAIKGRLKGNRIPHTADLILEMPAFDHGQTYTFSFAPSMLPPPQALQDRSMWPLARRGWFNAFQAGAPWGNPEDHNRGGIAGILANNVVSDPCSISQMFYGDLMLWTPDVAEGISIAQLVRRTIDFWLEKRTLLSHEAIGYGDYIDFLDGNPNLLICAWDYVEATGDLTWLKQTIGSLEGLADFTALRDQDRDGLVEAVQSGNADTLWTNNRSSNWFDAMNYGHKDAYTNALIYRAWRCLADLEARLLREEKRARYAELANRLKAAYAPALYNPETGWVACWRSEDGKLHDYASPIIGGMAVEYGLVTPRQGKAIVDKLWAKIQTAGFHRFDLGIPTTLDPVRRSDYLQPNSNGCPKREDGTDTFQQYQNGGISAGHTLHFLMANYLVGYQDKADMILRAMLGRQQKGAFQNGVRGGYPNGGEWTTWDGKPCGYEGYLPDVYFFLQAVLLRESAFRTRYLKPLLSV